jgi:diguanylate cyclase (GGDEF)-like protein
MGDPAAEHDTSDRRRGQAAPPESTHVLNNSATEKRPWNSRPITLVIASGVALVALIPIATAITIFNLPDHALSEAECASWRTGALCMTGLAALLAVVTGGIVCSVAKRIAERLHAKNVQLHSALGNMSQGLIMLDAAGRLVLCNDRYRQMYRLTPDLLKPGCALLDILKHRAAHGTFSDHPECFVADLQNSIERGTTKKLEMQTADGRIIAVVNQPMAGGGWVSTHEDVTEQKRAEKRIKSAHDNLLDVIEVMPAGLVIYDEQDRLVQWNRRYDEIYSTTTDLRVPGARFEDMLRAGIARGMYAEALGREEEWLAERLALHAHPHKIHEQRMSDGRWLRVEDYKTSRGGFIGVRVDITELKQREEELQLQNMKLDAALQNMSQGLVMFDVDRKLVFCNQQYANMYNLPSELIEPGITQEQILEYRIGNGIISKSNAKEYIEDRTAQATAGVRSERLLELTDGRTLSVVIQPLPNGGWVTTHQDITERRRAEIIIDHMAHYDALTNVPNRATFNDAMEAMLDRARANGEQFAVLSIDLDFFKEANDTYGHAVGDALLREVARRLQAAAGEAFLARIGGDEFVLIVADGPQPAAASTLADRLLAAFGHDFEVESHRLKLGMSIGVALYPTDGSDAKTLMANADVALYRAKAEFRGSALFYESEMGVPVRKRHAMQEDLRFAIDRGELLLHYQPQVRMSGEITGFEALVRWQCAKRGLVSPGVFIPIAEESGLIISIGQWVLREACREAASWPRPLTIAVNISPIQFHHGDLPQLVHSILLETGLAPARLELEVTEGVMIRDFSRAVSILNQLKALGVRVALDDFGTGYSSLSYLQSFKCDKVKIDRVFISDLETNHHSKVIVRAIVGLCRSLGLPTLAEGVETEDQRAFLREGCDEVQGYLTGRPLPIADYDELVGRQPARRLSNVS